MRPLQHLSGTGLVWDRAWYIYPSSLYRRHGRFIVTTLLVLLIVVLNICFSVNVIAGGR